MARKLINYDDWLRTRSLVEARAKRILSYFDLEKLKRKRHRAEHDKARSRVERDDAF